MIVAFFEYIYLAGVYEMDEPPEAVLVALVVHTRVAKDLRGGQG